MQPKFHSFDAYTPLSSPAYSIGASTLGTPASATGHLILSKLYSTMSLRSRGSRTTVTDIIKSVRGFNKAHRQAGTDAWNAVSTMLKWARELGDYQLSVVASELERTLSDVFKPDVLLSSIMERKIEALTDLERIEAHYLRLERELGQAEQRVSEAEYKGVMLVHDLEGLYRSRDCLRQEYSEQYVVYKRQAQQLPLMLLREMMLVLRDQAEQKIHQLTTAKSQLDTSREQQQNTIGSQLRSPRPSQLK